MRFKNRHDDSNLINMRGKGSWYLLTAKENGSQGSVLHLFTGSSYTGYIKQNRINLFSLLMASISLECNPNAFLHLHL